MLTTRLAGLFAADHCHTPVAGSHSSARHSGKAGLLEPVECRQWSLHGDDRCRSVDPSSSGGVDVGFRWSQCENDDYRDDFQGLRRSDLVERLVRNERRLGNGFATPDYLPALQFFEFSRCLAAQEPIRFAKSITTNG